ncbi:glycosyltransferase [Agreia sp. PsM10]|uniref:glycosyltransferase family protein n=1 Tax=Agreia sp. PsM10 TaxID=3030533 RepID=UPI00263A5CAF|nr:glycosyltransferase [Agreia sp. PsM10]MDN4639296.1 glycosyltransferase [Agreia sp. PsM10]
MISDMQRSTEPSPPRASDENISVQYENLVQNRSAEGPLGVIAFAVSTIDLTAGKGDLFVAAGLARALNRQGWGVAFWPRERWDEPVGDDVSVVVAMLESFVPDLVPDHVACVAWVRNWAKKWADLPYLNDFDEIWCSSSAAAAFLDSRYEGSVRVLPIGVDDELFTKGVDDRPLSVVSTANDWGVERQISRSIESLAQHVDVTWFGTSGHGARRLEGVDRRDSVDYFAVPAIYGQARVVIDDVIDAAKEFGSQNSRLYEAIAAGAFPITNCLSGLDDLGLDDVPVYRDSDDLAAIVPELLADPQFESRLDRLRAVVIDRHTYDRRASESTPWLHAVTERRASSPRERTSLARWLGPERRQTLDLASELESTSRELIRTSEALARQTDETGVALAEIETLGKQSRLLQDSVESSEQELADIRASRAYKLARRLSSIVQPVARRLRRR